IPEAKRYKTMLSMLMSLVRCLNQLTGPMTGLIPTIMTLLTPGSLLSHSEKLRTWKYTGAAMEELKLQPIAFLSKQSPHVSVNHLLVKSVNAAIKKQVKHVRPKLRNILLTGIVSGSEPELPRIPNIVGFSLLLWRHLNDSNRTWKLT
ncbi:hypothetical protein VP01_7629g1, partial [Puccinia sorghi]